MHLYMWKMLHWLVWLFVCAVVSRSQDVSFSIPSITCSDQMIRCHDDADDMNGHIEMTKAVQTNFSVGYVLYRKRVRMLDPNTGESSSFSTKFTFRITKGDMADNKSADGFVFAMFANQSYRGDPGFTLGVYKGVYDRASNNYLLGRQETKIFSVEFDTWSNVGVDPNAIVNASANHVGVNLETIVSNFTEEADKVGIVLNGGYNITSWIDYNFSKLNLEVRIAKESNVKPAAPLFNYTLNLSSVVDEFMTVGFAAASGRKTLVEYHALFNWGFKAFGLKSSGKRKMGVIVGVPVGIASVVLFCCLGLFAYWVPKAKIFQILKRVPKAKIFQILKRPEDYQSEVAVVDIPLKFTYNELSVATNGFSERSRLGQGGSASVYRGVIPSTLKLVAVKRVARTREEGKKEFEAEIKVVSRLRHRNLIKLLGWCADGRNYLLVYELMPKGSLDKLLFDDGGSTEVLSWPQRLTIVGEVAAALGYLHQGYTQQVIHRDIKSSNVMLDDELHARVGDFGLARLIDHSKNLETTHLAGTVGYIAPEAVLTSKSTDKTDVYAFGALTLEVACGRRPIDTNAPQQEIILVDWVWNCYAQGNILRAADARLAGKFPESEMEQTLLMGLLCSHPDPDARPSMSRVEMILAGAVPLPPVPRNKPRYTHVLLEEMMAGMRSNVGSTGGYSYQSLDESFNTPERRVEQFCGTNSVDNPSSDAGSKETARSVSF